MTSNSSFTEGALADLQEERARQIDKGWTPEHDDEHGIVHLVSEAQARLRTSKSRKTLVEPATMLVAAIEVLDRRSPKETPSA